LPDGRVGAVRAPIVGAWAFADWAAEPEIVAAYGFQPFLAVGGVLRRARFQPTIGLLGLGLPGIRRFLGRRAFGEAHQAVGRFRKANNRSEAALAAKILAQ
jgi:hypothetical protein